MPAAALHPRSATEIIDASFQLLRQYYPQLVTVSVVALAPYMALSAFTGSPVMDLAETLGIFVAQLLCASLAEAAVVVAVSDGYLEGEVDVRRALVRAASRIPTIIGAWILRVLAMLLGMVALLFPGIYIGLRTFATTPAVMLEDRSASESISRSWQLGKGEVGKIFITLLLAWMLYGVLLIMLQFLIGTFVGRGSHVLPVLTAVMLAFIYPFIIAVTTLLYYDLRVRHEGFDLELLAREASVPAPDGAPARSGLE